MQVLLLPFLPGHWFAIGIVKDGVPHTLKTAKIPYIFDDAKTAGIVKVQGVKPESGCHKFRE
jgi:hypothetical protein